MYHKSIDNGIRKEIDKYTSYVNLTPTIANLFNLDYDPRLYMGSDILSDEYLNVVAFADGSWKNDLAYYNAATNEITYYVEDSYTIDEIRAINETITNKMGISSLIIENDYYTYLDNAINIKEIENETYANIDTENTEAQGG